ALPTIGLHLDGRFGQSRSAYTRCPGESGADPQPGWDQPGGMRSMAFQGWPEAALDFYDGLEEDNSKAYWTAHKAIYDEAVRGPMTDLTEELGKDFGETKIFRPNRDIRFSADKSPYKTVIG